MSGLIEVSHFKEVYRHARNHTTPQNKASKNQNNKQARGAGFCAAYTEYIQGQEADLKSKGQDKTMQFISQYKSLILAGVSVCLGLRAIVPETPTIVRERK